MMNSYRTKSRGNYVGLLVFVLALWLAQPVFAQTPVPPSLTAVAAPAPASVGLVKQITPAGALLPGQEAQVVIRLSGNSLPQCFGTPRKPVDAVVLIDTSPSAGKPIPGSNLFRSKQILRSLWAQMDQPVYSQIDDRQPTRSRLAIVTVDAGVTKPEVTVRMPLTDTTEVISNTIAAIDNGADSEFASGVNRAAQLLHDSARPEAEKALILLFHDNFFTSQAGVQDAIRQASTEATVFILINWLNVPSAPNDERLHEADAAKLTSPERVLRDPSAEDLRRLFVQASGSDATVLARGFRVYDEISPSGLVDIIGIENGGRIEAGRVVWDISEVKGNQAVELRYRFRVRPGASAPLQVRTGATCLDCNGFLHSYLNQEGAPLQTPVSETEIPIGNAPTPTGTPAATATPVAGSQATSTPTPGPGAVPLPGAPFDWRWLLLLLLLIPLALFMWRRPGRKPPPQPPQPPSLSPPPPSLPETPKPGGETVRKGRAADDSALLERLRKASVIRGRIPTGQRGAGRARVVVRVFQSVAEMRAVGGLSLGSLGQTFLWDEPATATGAETATTPIPVDKLQGIIEERVSRERPLAAVWTVEPTDNATFHINLQPTPSGDRVEVRVRSVYRPPAAGAPPPDKAHWVELRFLNNPGGRQQIVAVPAIEVESGTGK